MLHKSVRNLPSLQRVTQALRYLTTFVTRSYIYVGVMELGLTLRMGK